MPQCLNHPDRPAIAKGMCSSCYNRRRREVRAAGTCSECGAAGVHARGLCWTHYQQQWRARHPDRVDAQMARARVRNGARYRDDPAYRERAKAKAIAFRRTPAGQRQVEDTNLRILYGITLTEKERMLASQDGRCTICARELPTTRKAHVDHCHATNRIRGLLCAACNKGLGMFADDPVRLEAAAAYVRQAAAMLTPSPYCSAR